MTSSCGPVLKKQDWGCRSNCLVPNHNKHGYDNAHYVGAVLEINIIYIESVSEFLHNAILVYAIPISAFTAYLWRESTGDRWIPAVMMTPSNGNIWEWDLMCSLICARINGWVNNRNAGDLRRNHAHYDVTVMVLMVLLLLASTSCW